MARALAIPQLSVAGFVLAGGHSSRMGTDKALVLLRGIPLIRIALDIFTQGGISAQIAGSRSGLSAFAPEIFDTFPDSGPLGGIHAAMTICMSEWTIFLPVDLPLMPASLLQCLLRRAYVTQSPVTAVRLNGRLQPFPVVLHRTALPIVEQLLDSGQTACHVAWQTVPDKIGGSLDCPAAEGLVQAGHCAHPDALPPTLWFQSANTPTDLALLEGISSSLRA